MRIPSGKTDQYIYFVAQLGGARVTGLSSFTVYRSRNGAAPVLYTTPTTTELSSANAPGVYGLLIDEDTTIASGSDSEEMVLHITKTGMDPVTRTIELYRRDTTSGRTLAISAAGEADANLVRINGDLTSGNNATLSLKQLNIQNSAGNAILAYGLAADATGIEAKGTGDGHGIKAWSTGGSGVGSGIHARGNDSGGAGGDGISGQGFGTGSGITAHGGADGGSGAGIGPGFYAAADGTGFGAQFEALTNAAVYLTTASGHALDLRGGGTGSGLNIVAGLTSYAALGIYGMAADTHAIAALAIGNGDGIFAEAYGTGKDIRGDITGNLSGSVGSVTGLTASDVGAIKTKTDSLAFTVAGQVDANVQYVNDVAVTGTGAVGDEWGP